MEWRSNWMALSSEWTAGSTKERMLEANGLTIRNEEWKSRLRFDSLHQILSPSMAAPLSCILMECAKAIEGGRLDVADSLLAVIQSLASKEESIWRRKVVKYFAEALVRRAYEIRPLCALPSLPVLCDPGDCIYEPLYEFAKITSKHAIPDALNSGYRRLHIIDFSIVFDFRLWNSLIGDLKRQYGGLQSVLITSIAPKLSKHTDYLRKNRERGEDQGRSLVQGSGGL